MKTIQSVLVSAALAVATAAPASAGVNDPEIILYRVSGVLNGNGATAFFCTNFSGVNENIRIVIRNADSPVLFNGAFPIAHLNTLAATTKGVGAYGGLNLALGASRARRLSRQRRSTSPARLCRSMLPAPVRKASRCT